MKNTVPVWKYFLWWCIALFSNAEIVCFCLSIAFAFSSADRSRANFFKAVLLYKIIFLIIGIALSIILIMRGFSFTAFLNSIDFSELADTLRNIISTGKI